MTKASLNKIFRDRYGFVFDSSVTLAAMKKELTKYEHMAANGPLLAAGEYNVSGDFKAITTNNGYSFFKINDKKMTFSEPTGLNDAKLKAIDDFLYKQKRNYVQVDVAAARNANIHFLKIEKRDLRQIKNRDANAKEYDLFKDVSMNEGQCVVDVIMYFMQKHTNMTRAQLVEELKSCVDRDEDSDITELLNVINNDKGYSINTMMRWVATKSDITAYVIDPFGNTISYHVAKTTRVFIACLMNNEHLYVLGDSQKKYLSSQKKIQMNELTFKEGFEDADFCTVQNCLNSTKKVVYVDVNCLSHVINEVIQTTNMIPCPILTHNNLAIKFRHPKTNQVFIASQDYDIRKSICDDLFAQTKYSEFKWNNQTYAQIFDSFLAYTNGKKIIEFKSYYSKEFYDILQIYLFGGYNACMIKGTEWKNGKLPPNMRTFDRRGCYTSCLLNNLDPYPVFSVHDHVERLDADATIPIGWAYISKDAMLGHMKFVLGWYPSFFVKYLIENGYDRTNVTLINKSSSVLPPKFFKKAVKNIQSIAVGTGGAKRIVNSGVGAWGKRVNKTGLTAVTDSEDVALAMLNEYPDLTIDQYSDLFHLNRSKTTPIMSGHVPLRAHIVCMGHILLHKMTQEICDENTIILGYKTDSIQVINPRKEWVLKGCKPKSECAIGEIHEEENKNLYGLHPDEFVGIPYEHKKREFTVVESGLKSFKVDAGAGYGKSFLLLMLYGEAKLLNLKVEKLAWTKNAANNIGGQTL
ncbi:hypothetical protein, partial [Candidatus Finniella inopinata]